MLTKQKAVLSFKKILKQFFQTQNLTTKLKYSKISRILVTYSGFIEM